MKGKFGLAAVVAILVVLSAVVLALTMRRGKGGEAEALREAPQRTAARPQILGGVVRAGKPRAKPKLSTARRRAQDDEAEEDGEAEYADMSPEDQKLADAIEKALDDESLSAACALAAKAAASTNASVRESMVSTLGWFGVKALPELTPFLADQDDSVRESAMGEWTAALSEIEDDAQKIGIVEMAMGALSDEDALEDISGEYIGIDERLAVESLLRVIEGGGTEAGVAKAKETYEFVTGEEFTDRAAAENWIQDNVR